ncbi:Pre-mRNA-splicing factor slt11 [Saitoella coloradoensis]
MPPKADINKSGWESSEFPAVCETCLGPNPYVRMTKDKFGKECKICTRPFTVFRWSPGTGERYKKTDICMTCARLKNCCQSCLLDLQFGLPIQIRDAALKLVAQGPSSDINKQYYAQNNEGKLKDGDTPVNYQNADTAARDLLRKLARSEPYFKRGKAYPCTAFAQGHCARGASCTLSHDPADLNPDAEGISSSKSASGGSVLRIGGPVDMRPPNDPKIASLFLTGVEDDLPEHAIRTFFSAFGPVKSVVCVHRARSAFVNFATRAGAEAAAETTRGQAVIKGCPLKVTWGRRTNGPLGGRREGENARSVLIEQEVTAKSEAAARAPTVPGRMLQRLEDVAPEEIELAPPPGADAGVTYKSQLEE